MTLEMGAWLASTCGGMTGWVAASSGLLPPRRRRVLCAVVGALCGVLAYGVFIVAGFALSVLTFSGPPDAAPALIGVALGCVAFLVLAWLRRAIGSRFGLPPADPRRPRTFQDLIDARPRGGRATMWLCGVGLPLLPLLHGLASLVALRGELGTLYWSRRVEGAGAVALGLGWVSVAAFLHFHFFFGLHPRLKVVSPTGKRVAIAGAAAGLALAGLWSVKS